MKALVVMGVAGCGKSSLGEALASALGWALIEGDDFHSVSNRHKMARGIALTDADRSGWLDELGRMLQSRATVADAGTVLTCSSLKRAYRDRLRSAAPGLGFVFLELDRAEAHKRVASRSHHMFPPSLVDSQFAALETPQGEPLVLALDATLPIEALCARAVAWVRSEGTDTSAAAPVAPVASVAPSNQGRP